jgi:hypothetical protein
MKYDDVMNLLHSTTEPVEFVFMKPEVLVSKDCDVLASSKSEQLNNLTRLQSTSSQPLSTPHKTMNQNKIITTTKTVKSINSINSPNENPRIDQIRPGKETLIEIERGKMGLGLSIVGGSDTQLPGIIIHDIYQNGAAFADKRLTIGDQILKVNDIDLTNATHDQVNIFKDRFFIKIFIYKKI